MSGSVGKGGIAPRQIFNAPAAFAHPTNSGFFYALFRGE
jgi:hypothetical protein